MPPEPLTDLTDWDWQVDAELPVPRLPFAVAPGNAEAKEPELAPQSPSVSTDIGDDLRIPAQDGWIGSESRVHRTGQGHRATEQFVGPYCTWFFADV